MKLTPEQQNVIEHRRNLLAQAAQMMEHDRCGPDLKARCGCTFLPWRHLDLRGIESTGLGLIGECDQANRLFEIAIRNGRTSQWESHVYFAREDADNQLAHIIELIVSQRKGLTSARPLRSPGG